MLDPNTINSQIDRAGLMHEPERAEIPPPIRREVRAFRRELLITAGVIEGILRREHMLQSLIEPILRKRGVGRQRKLAALQRKLPSARVSIDHKDVLSISWLSPRPPILTQPEHPGEEQDCVLVCFLLAWPPTPRRLTCHSSWALEVPDHATARLLQRSAIGNLPSALFEAGLGFATADADAVKPLIGTDTSIYLKAGDGAFAATAIAGTDNERVFSYARAATWLRRDMLGNDQQMLPRAVDPDATVALKLWHLAEDGAIRSASPFRA